MERHAIRVRIRRPIFLNEDSSVPRLGLFETLLCMLCLVLLREGYIIWKKAVS